eukprot:1153609-Pelagomonas_calceolata.AAC.3
MTFSRGQTKVALGEAMPESCTDTLPCQLLAVGELHGHSAMPASCCQEAQQPQELSRLSRPSHPPLFSRRTWPEPDQIR